MHLTQTARAAGRPRAADRGGSSSSSASVPAAASSCASRLSRFSRAAARTSMPPQTPRMTAAKAAAPAAPSPSTPPLGARLGAAYDAQSNMPDWNTGRRAGVLLHPTSLPGPHGAGDLGPEALAFLDWLASAGMQCWQVLPLVPPDPEYFSPYSGLDANCGNPLLISVEALVTEGLLDAADVAAAAAEAKAAAAKAAAAGSGSGSSGATSTSTRTPSSSSSNSNDADFAAVAAFKAPLLSKAARALLTQPRLSALRDGLARFRSGNPWIEDSALFDALRRRPDLQSLAWWDWPAPLRKRDPKALSEARAAHSAEIDEFVAVQYLFDRQWRAVKAYANALGIRVVGDMPIYVGGQSADVWANRHLFELDDETCAPVEVSGVPPDAFSETGQLWGSPLYRWRAHADEGYAWWASRLRRAFDLFDETRVDHFRAFAGYWAVGADEETAMNGSWRQGPGIALFDALKAQLGDDVPIMAEDLGVITKDVVALREEIGAPGMVVLQFAWGGGPTNVHLPHMHYANSFCYPGTHDNETSVGWWRGSASEEDKAYLSRYLQTNGEDIAWDFIRAAMQSVSRTSIFMMQDVLRLGNEARMNTPGRAAGNWAWRVDAGGGAGGGGAGVGAAWKRLAPEARALRELSHASARLPRGARLDHA